ncbi:MAG TPA: hypothetical protein VMT00_03025 [Thermoanaerobaculia bacterium]|nr:hypothetical protein [Thermoanaerobaculia bacterium]
MHVVVSLLLVASAAHSLHDLVLSNGRRIAVQGETAVQDGRVVFRSPDGTLYSVSIEEIDMAATEARAQESRDPAAASASEESARFGVGIRVSEQEKKRILEEMSRSRGGQPPPQQDWEAAKPIRAEESIVVDQTGDEWYWRNQARSHEESVRRAREELDLLLRQQRELEDQVLGFLSLGYKPNQFSYQVFRLQLTRDSIPRAQLAIERAERSYAQFRDDARRRGILPGWLR